MGVGTNLALQIIEPKRKTDNGHRVISRGLKLVTKQWMNHYEGWHDKHYFGVLKCFFLLNAQTKGSRPKPSTLWWRWRVPLLNRCVACALADILGKEWFLSLTFFHMQKKKQNKQISSFLAALIMILFTLQEQKSHLINLSLNLCWEFVTDVNENLNTHSTNIFKSY